MEESKAIILDTSILFHIEEYKLNIFEEARREIIGRFKFYIPSNVLNEIKTMAKNKGKKGVKAKTALLVIEKYKKEVEIIETKGRNADESVLKIGEKFKGVIATSDKNLKNRALRKGLKVLIASGKKIILI